MSKQRRSTLRPPPSLEAKNASVPLVADLLKRNHRLEVPTSYLVIVEGTTDVHYLKKAAELAKAVSGVDLLDLGPSAPDGVSNITVCTPINPEDPAGLRGGLPQIERLATDLRSFIIEYELPSPICFMLDHDRDGVDVARRLRDRGFNMDRARSETLEPQQHPLACPSGRGETEVVIEDLLSMRIQKEFFGATPAWCDVSYRNGEVVRCVWQKESKADLCAYVCEHAELLDLIEVVRVLARVRRLWRLDVPPEVERLFDTLTPAGGN
ncbi:MAG: hypothetical protein ABFD90_19455 [Phycisphaerales bacterium]